MRSDFKNEKGKRYGKLLVIGLVHGGRSSEWLCICDCGEQKLIQGSHLRAGQKTCGCEKGNNKHGLAHTRIWRIYQNMLARCNNPKDQAYKNYGGRGIKCLWKTFEEFHEDMKNGYNKSLTIDRIDNNGHYSKVNCRWVSKKIQGNNTRRNIYIEIKGRRQTLAQWCQELNLNYWTMVRRIHRNWPPIKALKTPIRKGNYK